MAPTYQDYADEPKERFLPISEELACSFYRMEMDAFQEDIAFYQKLLPQCGRVLELGCGTGRVACRIADRDRQVIGIDISMPMLRAAAAGKSPSCRFFCMDMVKLGFRQFFDTIIIPYNTLNLLPEEDRLLSCLKGCRSALRSSGKIFTQIFLPPDDLLRQGRNTFQFQMFDRPGGGRIIKEILKRPNPQSETLEIEERFRVRPMQKGPANEDYHSIYRVAAFPLERWLLIFTKAGFTPERSWNSYDLQRQSNAPSTCCIFQLNQK